MATLTPTEIDELRQLRRLSESSDRAIWLMESTDRRRFALKTLVTPLLAFRARTNFYQRLNLLLRLKHEHLVMVHAGRVQGTTMLTLMDYVPRGSLYDAVAPGERRNWSLPLPPPDAGRLIIEVGSGMQALHGRDIIHGGLKLTNILLSPGNDGLLHARITDTLLHAGVGGALREFGARPVGIADPFLYLAPEQYQHRPSLASDQYALAIIAYLLLTGEAPYTIDPLAYLQSSESSSLRAASSLNPILPLAVDSVLARALDRSPRGRYQTVRQFTNDLRNALGLAEISRAVSIAPESIPVSRARPTGELDADHSHESLEMPTPLAILRQGDAAPTAGLPDLPPEYRWTPEIEATLSMPVVTVPPRKPKRSIVKVSPQNKAVTAILIAAIALVGFLFVTLLTYVVASAWGH